MKNTKIQLPKNIHFTVQLMLSKCCYVQYIKHTDISTRLYSRYQLLLQTMFCLPLALKSTTKVLAYTVRNECVPDEQLSLFKSFADRSHSCFVKKGTVNYI